jgi:hypothetical protein
MYGGKMLKPEIQFLIADELIRARKNHSNFNNYHEGYAVILEELDELWVEIKGEQDTIHLKEEAIQVAAMAIRFIEDLDLL